MAPQPSGSNPQSATKAWQSRAAGDSARANSPGHQFAAWGSGRRGGSCKTCLRAQPARATVDRASPDPAPPAGKGWAPPANPSASADVHGQASPHVHSQPSCPVTRSQPTSSPPNPAATKNDGRATPTREQPGRLEQWPPTSCRAAGCAGRGPGDPGRAGEVISGRPGASSFPRQPAPGGPSHARLSSQPGRYVFGRRGPRRSSPLPSICPPSFRSRALSCRC